MSLSNEYVRNSILDLSIVRESDKKERKVAEEEKQKVRTQTLRDIDSVYFNIRDGFECTGLATLHMERLSAGPEGTEGILLKIRWTDKNRPVTKPLIIVRLHHDVWDFGRKGGFSVQFGEGDACPTKFDFNVKKLLDAIINNYISSIPDQQEISL